MATKQFQVTTYKDGAEKVTVIQGAYASVRGVTVLEVGEYITVERIDDLPTPEEDKLLLH